MKAKSKFEKMPDELMPGVLCLWFQAQSKLFLWRLREMQLERLAMIDDDFLREPPVDMDMLQPDSDFCLESLDRICEAEQMRLLTSITVPRVELIGKVDSFRPWVCQMAQQDFSLSARTRHNRLFRSVQESTLKVVGKYAPID